MRRSAAAAAALALALCLALTGCAHKAAWRFEPETTQDAGDYIARSGGAMLSWYVWELPRLRLVSDDATPGERPPEELAAVRDAFNAAMEQQHALLYEEYHELEQLAILSYGKSGELRELGSYMEVTETRRTARLVSFRAVGYVDHGGAHPWRFERAWNFDTTRGAFVTWPELAKKPDALRAALAGRVSARIRERGMDAALFPGWADTVASMEACEVFFGADGFVVTFGEQVIGPRTLGLPSFTVGYDEVEKYLSAYGRELIKKEG